jgi:Met-zincin/Domain of unknown function (DUF5117)
MEGSMHPSSPRHGLLSPFALVLVLIAGAAAPPAAAWAGAREPAGTHARKKKDAAEASGKKGGAEAQGKVDADKPKEPPFDKAVKGATEVPGLFNVYVKQDEGKYLLELAPNQFDTPFLLNPTLVSGIGQAFLYPADMLPEYVVSFHRNGKLVQLIHRNVLFRAGDGSTMKGPASLAAPDAIVGQAKIESQPHPDRKSLLVDLGTIVLNDMEGLGPVMKTLFEAPYQFDKEGSGFASLKGFPGNLDFETVLHFRTPEVKKPLVYAADSRSLLVRFHYSIARLPETGYRPRLADDRVGHFLAMIDDYSDDREDQPTVRYVTRWQLEKKDPSAALSEPKQPIVFYLENTIPPEYRDAVRRGVLGWNEAFEAIGFKNAMVVKQQPDDPDWDAADVRYATLRWIVAPHAGFAQGPSRINPYTGQIFDADIRFSADMMRNIRREYGELVAPPSAPAAGALAGDGGDGALPGALRGWTAGLGPLSLERMLAIGSDPRGVAASPPLLGAGARPGWSAAAHGYCDVLQGAAEQAGFGWNILQARGVVDPEAEKRYLDGFITYVTMHEVGHTLGLRHNFKASGLQPYAHLQQAALTTREGLTGSVMDYIPVNLARRGQTQGEYWQTHVGPYDRWAIEYAYRPLDAASPEAERPALDRIAQRAGEPALAYGTDEDTFGGSPRGMDPDSNLWDLGDDLLAYYSGRTAIARELFAGMESRFEQPGMRYQKLLLVFGQGIGEIIPAAINVPKFIGGIRQYRDHVGDPNGRLPYVPVPAARQREALAFLNREILGPDALQVPAHLLNKLAIERFPDIEGAIWEIPRNDLPIHDLMLAIRSLSLDRLYHPITLGRIHDAEARYASPGEAFTMAEMFAAVRRAIWDELDRKTSVNSFRRDLQRKHLQTLIRISVELDLPYPEDARTLARADLLAIRRGIDALVAPGGTARPGAARLDAVTRAHLDETRARITAALEASIERRLPRPQGGPAGQSG